MHSAPAIEPATAGIGSRPAQRCRRVPSAKRKPRLDDAVLLDLGRQWQAAAAGVRTTLDKIYEVERRLAVPADAEAPPELRAAQEDALAASDAATRLRQAIVRQPARTWAGLLVKLEIAASLLNGSADEEFEEALEEDENATGLALHASMIRDFAALPQQPDPDAKLLALGEQFEAAWGEQRKLDVEIKAMPDAAYTPAHERAVDRAAEKTSVIVDQIEKLRPTTLAGFAVKARACSWRRSGDPFDDGSFGDGGGDSELAGVIITDLLALDGRPLPAVLAARTPAVTKAA